MTGNYVVSTVIEKEYVKMHVMLKIALSVIWNMKNKGDLNEYKDWKIRIEEF